MKQTILIVDDDKDLCLVLGLYLRSYGFTPIALHSLTEVEYFLMQKNPAMILLDNKLDDGMGIDFITQFKKWCPDVPIVLMTADTEHELRQSSHFGCIDGLLLKPFSPVYLDELLKAIPA